MVFNIYVDSTKRERQGEGHSRTGNVDWRKRKEGEEVQKIAGYAVRGRCGHRIAIVRRAGEDDDGDRDCVLGFWTYGLRGKNR